MHGPTTYGPNCVPGASDSVVGLAVTDSVVGLAVTDSVVGLAVTDSVERLSATGSIGGAGMLDVLTRPLPTGAVTRSRGRMPGLPRSFLSFRSFNFSRFWIVSGASARGNR
jgi:hypothetical protein